MDQEGHRVEPLADGGGIGERRRQPRAQEAGAGAGDRPVDDGEEAAYGAPIQRDCEFQVAAGRGVDRHGLALGCRAEPAEPGKLALLGQAQIGEDGTGRRLLGAGEIAEAVEGGEAVQFGERPFARGAVEQRLRLRREDALPLGEELEERRRLEQGLRRQQLAGLQPGERRRQGRLRDRRHGEFSGRHVTPGESEPAFGAGQRREVVGRPRVEQRVLAERPRRDQPDDFAADDGLRAALACLGRVLHLLAHRDLETLADQALQVALGAVDGHAAHRHGAPLVGAALGQRDVERLGGARCVVEEYLVEVAHPIEQQVVRMSALDLEILHHHRRRRLYAPHPRLAARPGGTRSPVSGVPRHGVNLPRPARGNGSRAISCSCHRRRGGVW